MQAKRESQKNIGSCAAQHNYLPMDNDDRKSAFSHKYMNKHKQQAMFTLTSKQRHDLCIYILLSKILHVCCMNLANVCA